MPKDRMIEALGERHLLLPGLVASALGANDRVKYLLTLLQAARSTADGAVGVPSLREERLASGVANANLDRVVSDSAHGSDGMYRIPGAQTIVHQAIEEVDAMLAPLKAGKLASAPELEQRMSAVADALNVRGDEIRAEDLTRLTSGQRDAGDSLHLVVMDAHRELEGLEARIATTSVDGARTHDLEPRDRELVSAFMRGVHSTERLKFDHPGLGTLATRTGPRLVIQNDLGETDAHVVVIRITERVVSITYTDVHLTRLLFFQELLGPWQVAWEDTRSRSDKSIEGGLYHLASARFEGGDDAELARFLEHLGSRLVFIIDWNRARKRLRRLVGRGAAITLLRWAADQGYGHIAFLRAGADGLVYEALEFAGGRAVRAGESLQDVLGAEAAQAYLRGVLRICAEGLLAGKLTSLVQDEVRAELTAYLRSARQELLMLAVRHAEVSVEIAETARDALEQAILGSPDRCRTLAGRARRAEHAADELVSEARVAAARASELGQFLQLIEAADDIADSAEEAAFYASLLSAQQPAASVRPAVRRIARLVLAAAREYLRAVALSTELRRGGPRSEMDSFLAAAHHAIALERETDDAQRTVHQALLAEAGEAGTVPFAVVELTRAYEEAADALMHSAHLIREHTLARVVGSEASAHRSTEAPRPPAPIANNHVGEHVYVLGDHSVPVPDPSVVGAKGHALARVVRAGLRVPEGSVLTTAFWRSHRGSSSGDAQMRDGSSSALEAVERRTGLRLGSSVRPLLLSVRSGAPVSMPGMLETVLNVGLCDGSIGGLIALTGNPRLAWDSYRRLVESFASVVDGCPHEPFERALRKRIETAGVTSARQLTSSALEELTRDHLDRYAELTGSPFPQDPMEQLLRAVRAVLASWDAPKARDYRRLHGISDGLGTAAILQRMVFGNAGGVSGAGVAFTRDPALGERRLYMDFLLDAQGEDVVAGRRTAEGPGELAVIAPHLLGEIEQVCRRLEREFADAQEFELTVQEGELFVLQTRTAKRTPWAALQIATDQVHERLISPSAALERLSPIDLDALVRTHVRAADGTAELCRASSASVGVAAGPIALDLQAVDRLARAGTPPVLVRPETVTEDVAAVALAAGVLTGAGSRTSHAAVVARELGKPCLVGCEQLALDLQARTARIGEQVLAEGEVICLDAESGQVFAGTPEVVIERPTARLAEIAAWRAARDE